MEEAGMKFYLAPLEGITGYIYRSTYYKYFGEIDKYFTPFISPNKKKICRTREKNDILPENNAGMYVVPQILTNHAEAFLNTVHYLQDYGYEEVNLNLGCPVGTVVSKGKGAGFLAYPDELRTFFDEIFCHVDIKISVKTRIGMSHADEFALLLDIFNEFPLHELIIHPRTREDYYKHIPNWESFAYGYERSRAGVCYNGDLYTKGDFELLVNQFPQLEKVMFGRGILRCPGIISSIKYGLEMKKEQLHGFHDELYERYKETLPGEKPVLCKMKELWSYLIHSFEYDAKIEKKLKKSQKCAEYDSIIQRLFSEYDLCLCNGGEDGQIYKNPINRR